MDKLCTNEDEIDDMVITLQHHLFDGKGRQFRTYCSNYWICETLAMLNMVIQAFIYDWILYHELYSYGWRYILYFVDYYNDKDTMNPGYLLFARTTTCERWVHGSSGALVHTVSPCVLILNGLFEKASKSW